MKFLSLCSFVLVGGKMSLSVLQDIARLYNLNFKEWRKKLKNTAHNKEGRARVIKHLNFSYIFFLQFKRQKDIARESGASLLFAIFTAVCSRFASLLHCLCSTYEHVLNKILYTISMSNIFLFSSFIAVTHIHITFKENHCDCNFIVKSC